MVGLSLLGQQSGSVASALPHLVAFLHGPAGQSANIDFYRRLYTWHLTGTPIFTMAIPSSNPFLNRSCTLSSLPRNRRVNPDTSPSVPRNAYPTWPPSHEASCNRNGVELDTICPCDSEHWLLCLLIPVANRHLVQVVESYPQIQPA